MDVDKSIKMFNIYSLKSSDMSTICN